MLPRAALTNRSAVLPSTRSDCGFLPILYCTRTILRSYAQYRRPQLRHDGNTGDGSDGFEAKTKDGAVQDFLDDTREKRTHSHKRASRKRGEIHKFGNNGYKVNKPWENVWKGTSTSRSIENQSQEVDDESYSPFAARSGPSSRSVNTKSPPRIHRDTSYVPFERATREVRENPYADLEGTTITPSEKKAFESLFELYKPSIASQGNLNAKSLKEDVGSDPANNAAKNRIRKIDPKKEKSFKQPYRVTPELPEPLKKLRQAAMEQPVTDAPANFGEQQPKQIEVTISNERHRRKKSAGDSRSERLERLADQDVFDTNMMLLAQNSDTEVWALLYKKVLNSVLSLELDGPRGGKSHKRKVLSARDNKDDLDAKRAVLEEIAADSETSSLQTTELPLMERPDVMASDATADGAITYTQPLTVSPEARTLQTLSRSAPQHLISVFNILTDRFPASPLPLNLIPLVKSLGPSTAALCLSTKLYNLHIQHHWNKYHDLLAICDILQEMDDNVYEFDGFTRDVVWNITRNVRAAHNGDLGVAAQVVAGMDRAVQGSKRLRQWMDIMRDRRQDEALRRAREMEAMELEHKEEFERTNVIEEQRELGDMNQGLEGEGGEHIEHKRGRYFPSIS